MIPYRRAATQQISNTRSNAQTSLPFIPNNGNPNGANNMRADSLNPRSPSFGNLDWLRPSAHMNMVNNMLAQPLVQTPNMMPVPGQEFGNGASPSPTMENNKQPYPVLPVVPNVPVSGQEFGTGATPSPTMRNNKQPYPVLPDAAAAQAAYQWKGNMGRGVGRGAAYRNFAEGTEPNAYAPVLPNYRPEF